MTLYDKIAASLLVLALFAVLIVGAWRIDEYERLVCPRCAGSGTDPTVLNQCSRCHGWGTIPSNEEPYDGEREGDFAA